MEVRAIARYQRVSPRKARLVVDLIKGKTVEEAQAILQHLDKGSAPLISQVLRSATANAENNFNLDQRDLYVKRALADEGPRMKRVWMRGRGRRDTKLHRTSHITVVVDEASGDAPRVARAAQRTAITPRVAGRAPGRKAR